VEVSGHLQAPGERAHGTHWIGGWVDPEAALETVEKNKYLVPAVNRTPAVQPVASRYTD
jgi:hypothetical protein